MIKINKITVQVDMEDDDAVINMYKTNKLLGSVHYDEVDMISPVDSGLTVKSYMEYARDVVMNLIENGGIQGYYYEEKQQCETVQIDNNEFRKRSREYMQKILGDNVSVSIDMNSFIEANRYKNGCIKDAQAEIDTVIDGMKVSVRCEVKSGQVCKPRIMIYKNQEYPLNITNVRKLLKSSQLP